MSNVKILIIDGVRVREDEARERGIHPEQVAAAAVAKAEALIAEQEEAEKLAASEKAKFDALVEARALELIAERDVASAKVAADAAASTPAATPAAAPEPTLTGGADKKTATPSNKAASPATK